MFKKLVLVTRKTRLEELVEHFNTRSQAKFYIEHAGGDFLDYEREDDAYRGALDLVRRSLDSEIPLQLVNRALIPTFQFQKEENQRDARASPTRAAALCAPPEQVRE